MIFMNQEFWVLFLTSGLLFLTGCQPGIDREALLRFFQENHTFSDSSGKVESHRPGSSMSPAGVDPGIAPPMELPPVPVPPVPIPAVPLPAAPLPAPVLPPKAGLPKGGWVDPLPAQVPPVVPPLPPPLPLPPPVVPIPAPTPAAEIAQAPSSKTLTLGVDYVMYRERFALSAVDVESEKKILKQWEEVNQIWKPCEIQFQLDHFRAVDPSEYHLNERTMELGELNEIRARFATETSLLVVLTHAWDRRGSLGSHMANGWTTLPGDGIYGAILEGPTLDFPNILAHELGHYLNLKHSEEKPDLMHPIVYPHSVEITPLQCEEARSTAQFFWKRMLRDQALTSQEEHGSRRGD